MRGGTIERLAAAAAISAAGARAAGANPARRAHRRRRAPRRTSTWAWPSACVPSALPRRSSLCPAAFAPCSSFVEALDVAPRRSSTRRCHVDPRRRRRDEEAEEAAASARSHREERRRAGFRAVSLTGASSSAPSSGRRSRSSSRSMRCRSVRGRDRRGDGASWARRCHRGRILDAACASAVSDVEAREVSESALGSSARNSPPAWTARADARGRGAAAAPGAACGSLGSRVSRGSWSAASASVVRSPPPSAPAHPVPSSVGRTRSVARGAERAVLGPCGFGRTLTGLRSASVLPGRRAPVRPWGCGRCWWCWCPPVTSPSERRA